MKHIKRLTGLGLVLAVGGSVASQIIASRQEARVGVAPALGRSGQPQDQMLEPPHAGLGVEGGALVGVGASSKTIPRGNELLAELPRVPLHFEPLDGQSSEFVGQAAGYRVRLTGQAAEYTVRAGDSVRTYTQRHVGPSGQPVAAKTVQAAEQLVGRVNRMQGADKASWRRNIPTFGRVMYAELYPGIDLVYYGNQRSLESDYVVAPGADPAQIRFEFGADAKLSITDQGELRVATADGELIQKPPFAYQERGGERLEIASRYSLQGGTIGFELGDYDRDQRLVIDPVLLYTSYLGGASGRDAPQAVAVDTTGNIYVAGLTSSTDFPVQSPVQSSSAARDDVFVSKLSADGTTLLFSTYLGGAQDERVVGLHVHSDGTVYVGGETNSADFPTTRCNTSGFNGCARACDVGEIGAFSNFCGSQFNGAAYCTSVAGCFTTDVFFTRLSAAGDTLLYSTFFGGSDGEFVKDMAVDVNGVAYLVGSTRSSSTAPPNTTAADMEGFPVTADAYDQLLNTNDTENPSSADEDGFVVVLDPTQDYSAGRRYASYLGGSTDEEATGVAVDSAAAIYIIGRTNSADFPADNGWATSRVSSGTGSRDGFLVKLDRNQSGTQQNVYGTFFGGDVRQDMLAIDLAGPDQVLIGGAVPTSTFPTTSGAYQTTWASSIADDAFVARFNTAVGGAPSLVWSTLLGGSAGERITDLRVAPSGAIYVVGETGSDGNAGVPFPAVRPFWTGVVGASFFASFTPNGSALNFSSRFRGGFEPRLAVAANGVATIVAEGDTQIIGTRHYQATPPGNGDGVLLQVHPGDADIGLSLTATPNPVLVNGTVTYTLRATNAGPTPVSQFDIDFYFDDASAGIGGLFSFTHSVTQGTGTCNLLSFERNCRVLDLGVGQSFEVEMQLTPTGAEGTVTGYAQVGDRFNEGVFHSDANVANNSVTRDVSVLFNLPAGADLAVSQTDAPDPVVQGANVTYVVTVTNQGPSAATGVTLDDTLPSGTALVSATPSQGSCSGTSVVTCDIGGLAANTSATLTLVVSTSSTGTVTNVATASGAEADAVSSNDSSSETTTVSAATGPVVSAGPCAGGLSDRVVALGDADEGILQFQLTAPAAEAVTVSGLSLTTGGSGDQSAVSAVHVYQDANADGQVDAGDTEVGKGVLSGGSLAITLDQSSTIDAASNACFLVTYDFSATTGNYLPPVPPRAPWLPLGFGFLLVACSALYLRREPRGRWVPALIGASLLLGPACGSEDETKKPRATGGAAGAAGAAGVGGSSGDAGSGNAGTGNAGSGGTAGAAGTGGSGGGGQTFTASLSGVSAVGDTSAEAAVVTGLPVPGVTLTLQ